MPEDWAGLLRGRSACPACGHPLAVRDLVPLAGFLLTHGRCRYCGARIAAYYPAVELLSAATSTLAFALLPWPQALLAALLGWWLLALALIDLRRLLLPDALTLPLLGLGLVLAPGSSHLLWPVPAPSPADAVIGAVVGYASFWLIAAAYRRLRGREGLGRGDAKLAAAAGAWLGWQALPMLLLLAALATLAAALLLSRGSLRADTALPFGPGLAAAFFLLYLQLAA